MSEAVEVFVIMCAITSFRRLPPLFQVRMTAVPTYEGREGSRAEIASVRNSVY